MDSADPCSSDDVSQALQSLFETSDMTWEDIWNAIQKESQQEPTTNVEVASTSYSENYEEEQDDDEKVLRLGPRELIKSILMAFHDDEKLVKLMMSQNMLKKSMKCKKCSKLMRIRRRKNSFEWRCRAKARGECSSCSIKNGSWFGYSKLSFHTMISFLMMHCERCPSVQIMKGLKITTHTVIELKKAVYELSTRIANKYPPLGGPAKDVQIEQITVNIKKNNAKQGFEQPTFQILAGQEIGSNLCFAVIIDEDNSVEQILAKKILDGTNVIKRLEVDGLGLILDKPDPSQHDDVLGPKLIFHELKMPVTESSTRSPKLLQDYLNDVIVRHNEKANYMLACVSEIQTYV